METRAFKDRLCLRKSLLEGGARGGALQLGWRPTGIKKTPVWLRKLFLDTSRVCFLIRACVSVPCFPAGSGHTCTPLSLCFGCQGLDTLSLFFLYLWERRLYPPSYTQTQTDCSVCRANSSLRCHLLLPSVQSPAQQ